MTGFRININLRDATSMYFLLKEENGRLTFVIFPLEACEVDRNVFHKTDESKPCSLPHLESGG